MAMTKPVKIFLEAYDCSIKASGISRLTAEKLTAFFFSCVVAREKDLARGRTARVKKKRGVSVSNKEE